MGGEASGCVQRRRSQEMGVGGTYLKRSTSSLLNEAVYFASTSSPFSYLIPLISIFFSRLYVC